MVDNSETQNLPKYRVFTHKWDICIISSSWKAQGQLRKRAEGLEEPEAGRAGVTLPSGHDRPTVLINPEQLCYPHAGRAHEVSPGMTSGGRKSQVLSWVRRQMGWPCFRGWSYTHYSLCNHTGLGGVIINPLKISVCERYEYTVCVHVCVYIGSVAHAGHDLPALVLALPPCLRQDVFTARWPESFWRCSCLCLCLPVGRLGLDICVTVAG